jgi:hypothetical protein
LWGLCNTTGLCSAPEHLNHKTCTMCTYACQLQSKKYLRCTKPANLDAIHQRSYCVNAHLPVTTTSCGTGGISGACKASRCDEQCWLKYLRSTLPTAVNMLCTECLKLTAIPAILYASNVCIKVSQGITAVLTLCKNGLLPSPAQVQRSSSPLHRAKAFPVCKCVVTIPDRLQQRPTTIKAYQTW